MSRSFAQCAHFYMFKSYVSVCLLVIFKVFCATCCSLKCRLTYMDRKEARVCVTCHSALTSGEKVAS